MVKKLCIHIFLITFMLLPAMPLFATEKAPNEGGGIEILAIDSSRPTDASDVDEPLVDGFGKITNISGFNIEIALPDLQDNNLKSSQDKYIAVTETRFLDLRGDDIEKETFHVEDNVTFSYKRFSLYLKELRKAEINDPAKGGKKGRAAKGENKSSENNAINLNKGVYSN